jgi:dGTPase
VGEEVLDELHPGGFRHNEQSLRVVDFLEKDGEGLNLTWEVREGVLKHSKTGAEIMGKDWGEISTLEGQVNKLADIVAYINHDIDDAIRAGIIVEDDLPPSAVNLLGHSHSERINTLVCNIVDHSWAVTGLTSGDKEPVIGMSAQVQEAAEILRQFLFDRVYNLRSAQEETERARQVVHFLYDYFIKREDELARRYAFQEVPVEQRVVDYIAGMTDQYALRLADEIQMPGSRLFGLPVHRS